MLTKPAGRVLLPARSLHDLGHRCAIGPFYHRDHFRLLVAPRLVRALARRGALAADRPLGGQLGQLLSLANDCGLIVAGRGSGVRHDVVFRDRW